MALTPNPYDLPEFAVDDLPDASGENNVVEPQAADKKYGWHPFRRRPERNIMNWLHRLTYNSLDWLKNTFYTDVVNEFAAVDNKIDNLNASDIGNDSTVTGEPLYFSTFFIRAATDEPTEFYDSSPDSGYSVDNLAPHAPEGLTLVYIAPSSTELSWDVCPDEDFQYFCVYRETDPAFKPSSENRVCVTTETCWTDYIEEVWKYTYKLTAVDINGNESHYDSAKTVTEAEIPEAPKAFALHQNVPNPFNPATTIRFDLPRAAYVRLNIYDVSGRLIRTLMDAKMEPGIKEIAWDGKDSKGQETTSGVYFYRLTAGSFTATKKMVLLK